MLLSHLFAHLSLILLGELGFFSLGPFSKCKQAMGFTFTVTHMLHTSGGVGLYCLTCELIRRKWLNRASPLVFPRLPNLSP